MHVTSPALPRFSRVSQDAEAAVPPSYVCPASREKYELQRKGGGGGAANRREITMQAPRRDMAGF